MARAKVLSREEVKRVMRMADFTRYGLRDRVALALSIQAGMRIGEIAALKTGDVRGITDENGNEQRREVAKRIKRWWVTNADGTVQLTVRYGSKPLEFAKGKNAIELSSASEIASTLIVISDAVKNGELDASLEVSSVFGRKLKKDAT